MPRAGLNEWIGGWLDSVFRWIIIIILSLLFRYSTTLIFDFSGPGMELRKFLLVVQVHQKATTTIGIV